MGNGSPRNEVLRALRAHDVFVVAVDESKNLYSLERADFLESMVLPVFVPMARLQHFKRKLEIPITHFWHSEEAEKEVEKKRKREDESH